MPQIKYYNSITLLKVCATFLITWFHLKPYAPDFLQPIFIGGALGNSLFFFASGFLIKNKRRAFYRRMDTSQIYKNHAKCVDSHITDIFCK